MTPHTPTQPIDLALRSPEQVMPDRTKAGMLSHANLAAASARVRRGVRFVDEGLLALAAALDTGTGRLDTIAAAVPTGVAA